MRANVQVGKGALCVGVVMVLALGAVAVMLPFRSVVSGRIAAASTAVITAERSSRY